MTSPGHRRQSGHEREVETLMRQRQDFYTLCPSCETRIPLTLAARLQASRHGTTCHCSACSNEWVCIHEWIYRELPSVASQPQISGLAREPVPGYGQHVLPDHAVPGLPQAAPGYAAPPMPRPHMLPTYQPPRPAVPAAESGLLPSAGQVSGQDQQASQPAPAPHAWSFERQASPEHQPSSGTLHDRIDR